MTEEDKNKPFVDTLSEVSQKMKESEERYERECEEYWKGLSYDEKLKAFYSVCKRIHQGDVVERGSYRYVLYDVFEFGPDAYINGMECGYMDIHNYIWDGMESRSQYNKETKDK